MTAEKDSPASKQRLTLEVARRGEAAARPHAREWLTRIAALRREVELEITRTPSGSRRNALTEVNIHLMGAETAARGAAQHDQEA